SRRASRTRLENRASPPHSPRGPGRSTTDLLFGSGRRPARRIDEIAEEVAVGIEQHARERLVVGLETDVVGLHRAIEGEEIRILAVGLGEDTVALAVALATGLLRLRGRLGDQDGDLAVGPRADLLRLLAALGADAGRDTLERGLHALIDRLAVLLRQIGAPDAHVDDGNAEGLHLFTEL